jgi:hypothetical protein
MAVTHPSSRISARQSTPQLPEPEFTPLFKPDEDAWKCVCGEVGVKYRGYIRPCESDKGKRFPATVLFNDRYGLVTGLPLSEFNAENVRARLSEKPDAPSVRRASSVRVRVEDAIEDSFGRALATFKANRARP